MTLEEIDRILDAEEENIKNNQITEEGRRRLYQARDAAGAIRDASASVTELNAAQRRYRRAARMIAWLETPNDSAVHR